MINITVCDDDPLVLDACKQYAEQYQQETRAGLDWMYMTDPEKMDAKALAKEDILILDIQMATLNGIDLAREIRRYNEHVIIIFSTNYLEYALQGYEVAAFRYLKKPLTYADFTKALTEALAQHQKSAQAFILVRSGYQTERLSIMEIMYCETESGHVKITLENKSVIITSMGISALEDKLRGYNFFRCHKGCLIHLSYVEQMRKTDVLMKDGALIPVSKHRIKEFMLALMKYWGGQLL